MKTGPSWFLTCLISALLLMGSGSNVAAPDWEPDMDDPAQERALQAIERLKAKRPEAQRFFDESYAYAVYPGAVRAGMFFGAGYGKGIVIEQGKLVAHSRLWQLTYAVFAGGQFYSQFLFFRDKEALEAFAQGNLEFVGQAAVAFLNLGAAADPSFSPGVALVTQTRFGFELELTPGMAYFTYRPVVPVPAVVAKGSGPD